LFVCLLLFFNDLYFRNGWKKKKNWTSPEIQNELLEAMAHLIQREQIQTIRQNGWFSIIADETTDVSTREQLSLLIRTVGEDLEAEEMFLGFTNVESTTGEDLTKVIKDTLLRLGLDIAHCRGQAYDGAANMAGRFRGVQARIAEEVPEALYLHCANHSLNLALQDIAKMEVLFRNALSVVHEAGKIIGGSAKRKGLFEDLCREEGIDSPSLSGLCQTRWTCRTGAIQKVLNSYRVLQGTLEEIGKERGQATAQGLAVLMEKGEIFLGISLARSLFGMAEKVSRNLQSAGLSFSEAYKQVALLLKELESLDIDSLVDRAWGEMQEMNLEKPRERRTQKIPARYEEEVIFIDQGQEEEREEEGDGGKREEIKQTFKRTRDQMVKLIKERFNQKNFEALLAAEELIVGGLKGKPEREKISLVASTWGKDLDIQGLWDQIGSLKLLRKETGDTLKGLLSWFRDPETKKSHNIFPDVKKLLKLLLLPPPSTACAERNFSLLRRLKTWLRSTMSQERLTHLALLATNDINHLSIEEVAREFVRANEREKVFVAWYQAEKKEAKIQKQNTKTKNKLTKCS